MQNLFTTALHDNIIVSKQYYFLCLSTSLTLYPPMGSGGGAVRAGKTQPTCPHSLLGLLQVSPRLARCLLLSQHLKTVCVGCLCCVLFVCRVCFLGCLCCVWCMLVFAMYVFMLCVCCVYGCVVCSYCLCLHVLAVRVCVVYVLMLCIVSVCVVCVFCLCLLCVFV